jgi:hypothetical protein
MERALWPAAARVQDVRLGLSSTPGLWCLMSSARKGEPWWSYCDDGCRMIENLPQEDRQQQDAAIHREGGR